MRSSQNDPRYTTLYSRPVYSNSPYTLTFEIPAGAYWYPSKAERELQELVEQFGRAALAVRLRRKEANRKAMSDKKSRQRREPARGQAPRGARLQTYETALHARMAPKKFGG